MAPPNFSGTWVIDHHDDFTPLLDLMKVPAENRPPTKITKLQVVVEQDGDSFKIISKTTMPQDRVNEFKVGEKSKFVMFGNMPEVEATAVWDGDRLVITDERGAKLVREIIGEQTVCTFSVGDVAVKLYYNKA